MLQHHIDGICMQRTPRHSSIPHYPLLLFLSFPSLLGKIDYCNENAENAINKWQTIIWHYGSDILIISLYFSAFVSIWILNLLLMCRNLIQRARYQCVLGFFPQTLDGIQVCSLSGQLQNVDIILVNYILTTAVVYFGSMSRWKVEHCQMLRFFSEVRLMFSSRV